MATCRSQFNNGSIRPPSHGRAVGMKKAGPLQEKGPKPTLHLLRERKECRPDYCCPDYCFPDYCCPDYSALDKGAGGESKWGIIKRRPCVSGEISYESYYGISPTKFNPRLGL